MLERIRGAYFSSHHFARDLIGTIAPLTAFALLALATHRRAQRAASTVINEYSATLTFWVLVLALIIYLVCGYFIGSIVGFAGNLTHRIVQRTPGIGRLYSYSYWHNKDADDIDGFYNKHITQHQYLLGGAAVTPTDKVNVLKMYFRRYNPEGYVEAYRQFMKVDLVRAPLLYALLFIGYEAYLVARNGEVHWWLLAFVLTVAIISLAELPRRIRKVVRTEYQFIIATARIKEDIERAETIAASTRPTAG